MRILKYITVIGLLIVSLNSCATMQSISDGPEVKTELSGSILHIAGTSRDDNISIQETDTNIIVYSANIEIFSFPKNQISEAVVWGFDGNDTIKNMHDSKYNSITFTAHGGNGNDIIWGGSGKNTLDGGNGDNMIIGGSGENIFYNTGSGSSAFFWRGTGDKWARGSKADYDDAQLVFYDKDRAGKTSDNVSGKIYDYVPWKDEDLTVIIDAIAYIYRFTGSCRYAHNPRTAARNGSNYFVLFDYPVYESFARNDGTTSTIQLKRGTYTKSTIIHELAHNWQGTVKGKYDKVFYYKQFREFWEEFKTISWTAVNAKTPDAALADFANHYGMTTWGEDWCTAFEAVFQLSDPGPNKSPKWNQKTEIVKRFLNKLKDI